MKKRLISIISALVLSVAAIGALPVGQALAAAPYDCIWTGAGDGTSFSDATNWNSCNGAAPQASDNDNLVFNESSLVSNTTLDDDISSLSVGSITFQNTNSNNATYTINGDAITTTEGIVDTSNGFTISSLAASGSQVFALDTQNDFINNLGGSGNVSITGTGDLAFTNLSNYTGTLSTTTALVVLTVSTNNGSFTSSGHVAVSGTGSLLLLNQAGVSTKISYNLPLSVGGSGQGFGFTAFQMGGYARGTTTLAGSTTLTSNESMLGDGTLKITGPLSGDFKLSAVSGQSLIIENDSSNNTSKTPGGSQKSAVQVITVSASTKNSSAYSIAANQELLLDGSAGSVSIGIGGLLKGDGSMSSLEVDSGGTVSPGHSPGCLTIGSGGLTMGGTYAVDIQGTTACTGYDQLKVGGPVDLTGGALTVSFLKDFTPKNGSVFEIINNTGKKAVAGTLSYKGTNLKEGATFKIGKVVFKISYKGGTGNDVTLTVITGGTPNTGMAFVSDNPIIAIAGTVMVAGGIYLGYRKLAFAKVRK